MSRVLLGSLVVLLLLSGCGEESKPVIEPKKEISKEEQSNKNIETIKEKSSEILNSSKEIISAVTDESKKVTEQVVEKAKEVSVEVAKSAKEITNDVAKNLNESLDTVIKTQESSTVDAKALYVKCAGCHGQDGGQHALGKSQIIKGWDKDKIKEALLGYKNGTYGSNMKGIMKGQVMNLSEDDINALAGHISNF